MRTLTVRELIIEVQMQLQRLGSFKRDKTSESLIVWRLNTAQDRFIRDSITPDPNVPFKFSINERSRSAIQPIIETNKKLKVYKDNALRSYCILPSDYAFLVNDRSSILPDCNAQYKTPTSAYTIVATTIPFNESVKSSAPYYQVTTSAGTVNKTVSYNLASPKESFEIIEAVAKQFTSIGALDVYWESFNGIYSPNSFIVINRIESGFTPPTYGLSIDGVAVSTGITNFSVDKYTTFAGNEYPNRSYKSDHLYDAIAHNYYDQPTPDSPVSQISGDKLYIFNSKRFLVSDIILDYIRKPRRISLYLNQSCELSGSVHENICSLATEMILGNIEADNYPLKVQENINRLD